MPAGGKVYPHKDGGEYYENKDRFHLVLSGYYDYTVDDETQRFGAGDLFWFDNKKMHSSINATPIPRISLIFDVEGCTDMSTDSENTEEKKTRTAEIELETHEIATKTTTPLHTTDWYIKWVSSIISDCRYGSSFKQSLSLEYSCSMYRNLWLVSCCIDVE